MRISAMKGTRTIWLLLVCLNLSCENRDQGIQSLSLNSDELYEQLAPLGHSIGSSRIVLLGENGHGVGEFTEAKVKLVQWLYTEKDFDVVVFESGFFECGHAWNHIDSLSSKDALYQSLRYPFQHAELVPLFDFIHEKKNSNRPLVLAGMDIQAQGFDSESRPAVLHDVLNPIDPDLADWVAGVDTALFLPARFGGQGDNVYEWAMNNGDRAKALYTAAANKTRGWERWVFRLSTGWIDRLALRGRAEAEGISQRPARYYELRDEWMAKAVTAWADSIDGKRKVVVWLHNDHARYGNFQAGEHSIVSMGSFLREIYGSDVYTVGFFMGRGLITDNGRNVRDVITPEPDGIEGFLGAAGLPANYLILRDNSNPDVREWAGSSRAYMRMGIQPMKLVPAEEFDALLYIDKVGPPDYEINQN